MAFSLSNTAEGGTDGTTVTTGNSGGSSGNAFNTVTPGTGGTITFTTAQKHNGSFSYNLTPGTASNCYVAHSLATPTSMTGRVYMYFTGWPTVATQLVRFQNINNGGGLLANLITSSNGKFAVQDNTGTIDNGPAAAILNTWLRMELTVASSTTNGFISANIFIGDSTSDLVYSFVTNTANTTTFGADQFAIGKITNSGNQATMYIDDILVQDNLNALGPTSTASVNWLAC